MNKQNSVTKPILECRNLHKTFRDGKLDVQVLHGIDLTIYPGEQLGIVGTSGAGKSTLLHILGGLDKPSDGKVFILQKDIHYLSEKERSKLRNKTLGFVYQFHHLLPEFTAIENVSMPLLIRKVSPKLAQEKAAYILEKVGLAERLQHKPGELSGGERQRTAIARALVTDPLCVLADEPTGNLDYKTANLVYETMLDLNREFKTSLVIVTHDPRLAVHMDKKFNLEKGEITPCTDISEVLK